MQIRRVKKKDRKGLGELLKVFKSFQSLDDFMMKMLCGRKDTYAIVAMEDKKIAGFGMINFSPLPDSGGIIGNIEDVAVDSNYQGRGLGTQLCKELINEAKKRQAKQIELTSNPKRIAAHKLYKKLGFKKRKTDVFELQFK